MRRQKLLVHEVRNVNNSVSVEDDFYHIHLYIAPLRTIHHMEHCNLKKMYVIGPHTNGNLYIGWSSPSKKLHAEQREPITFENMIK